MWITDNFTVFGDDHLEKNLNFALVKEMMGMAPDHYCVIDAYLPDFEYRLMQVLEHLPSHKVCLFPHRTSLGGPFSVSPWDTNGQLICARRSSLGKEYGVRISHAIQTDMVDFFAAGFLRWSLSTK